MIYDLAQSNAKFGWNYQLASTGGQRFINIPSGCCIETGGVEWGEGGRERERERDRDRQKEIERETESYYLIITSNILFINIIKLIKQYILTWIKMAS